MAEETPPPPMPTREQTLETMERAHELYLHIIANYPPESSSVSAVLAAAAALCRVTSAPREHVLKCFTEYYDSDEIVRVAIGGVPDHLKKAPADA